MDHKRSAGYWLGVQLLYRAAPLLLLLWGEALKTLDGIGFLVALLWGQGVEAVQLFAVTLLSLRRQLVEARQLLQLALLLGRREVFVILHPLFKMLLTLRGVGGGICVGASRGWILGGFIFSALGCAILSLSAFLSVEASIGWACGEQKDDCRAETKARWEMRFHDFCGSIELAAATNR